MKKVIDARGKSCPLPIIMVKKEVDNSTAGTCIDIMTDNEISCSNLEDYIRDIGSNVERTEAEGYTLLSFCIPFGRQATRPKDEEAKSRPRQRTYDNPSDKYVIAVTSDRMGEGDEELGRILLRSFINALPQADTFPSHIVLYNNGIRMAVSGTDTAETLLQLERCGVQVIICGACLEYYGLQSSLAAGRISNMYEIINIFASAHHIVKP